MVLIASGKDKPPEMYLHTTARSRKLGLKQACLKLEIPCESPSYTTMDLMWQVEMVSSLWFQLSIAAILSARSMPSRRL